MDDEVVVNSPDMMDALVSDTRESGFDMASEPKTGALLCALAASKPGGSFLELGTGTGISTAWLLAGMDRSASLVSVDNDPLAMAIARRHLEKDPRVTFVCQDGAAWLKTHQEKRYDFIFADTFPGKFTELDLALQLLGNGGLYVVDDLLPQKNWPPGHAPKVPDLLHHLETRPDFKTVRMAWASGIVLAVRQRPGSR